MFSALYSFRSIRKAFMTLLCTVQLGDLSLQLSGNLFDTGLLQRGLHLGNDLFRSSVVLTISP